MHKRQPCGDQDTPASPQPPHTVLPPPARVAVCRRAVEAREAAGGRSGGGRLEAGEEGAAAWAGGTAASPLSMAFLLILLSSIRVDVGNRRDMDIPITTATLSHNVLPASRSTAGPHLACVRSVRIA
eukprot:CAMPEP_0181289138 /NCGR_PEP_ID=MMETSP1101-20121128/722_1 /TAXON_ID=46948 /ORGANISM="Rhodomonas abbreviata, Strain Caron Lab Isolate" /LENGTH=126 /DNA_ID=CAMNT_0023393339 /DNA_START=241 /DNA_END=621 /DNA_ORIENTATION=+